MAETLTHWKKLHNPDYIGAYYLDPGQDLDVTIESYGVEKVPDTNGKKSDCMVLRFKGHKKPFVMNATNAKTITKVTGTPFLEEWVGKRITLYCTEVSAFGELVEAIRVRSKPPQAQKPVLDRNYKGWDAALQAVQSGETSIDFLLKKYTIPDDCLQILKESPNA